MSDFEAFTAVCRDTRSPSAIARDALRQGAVGLTGIVVSSFAAWVAFGVWRDSMWDLKCAKTHTVRAARALFREVVPDE